MTERDAIRVDLKNALAASPLSRAQIAEEVVRASGLSLTERRLNNYLAETREDFKWPAELDLALCTLLQDYTILSNRVARAGFRMIGPEEENLIAIGRAVLARETAEAQLGATVRLAGLHVVTDDEKNLIELGREYLRQKRAASAVAAYERSLQGVELE